MSDESRTRRDEQRRKYRKMDKRAKDKLVRSPRENGGGQDAQKDLHSRTGRDEKKGKKTQEKMERGSRKRSSSAGSEKMERVGGRQEKMEGHCSTGQSPQWDVVPMEEEELSENKRKLASQVDVSRRTNKLGIKLGNNLHHHEQHASERLLKESVALFISLTCVN